MEGCRKNRDFGIPCGMPFFIPKEKKEESHVGKHGERRMNKVILLGRLTRDPEVRYAQDGNMVIARYTLAVNRRVSRGQEPEADFINCVAFGKAGEFAEKYLHKGIKIGVVGRLQTGSYTNKNGIKVYTTEVVIEEHEFVESKGSAGGDSKRVDPQRESYASGGDGFINIPDGIDEELPFC